MKFDPRRLDRRGVIETELYQPIICLMRDIVGRHFHRDWKTVRLRGFHGLLGACNDPLLRDTDAELADQLLTVMFVDGLASGEGERRHIKRLGRRPSWKGSAGPPAQPVNRLQSLSDAEQGRHAGISQQGDLLLDAQAGPHGHLIVWFVGLFGGFAQELCAGNQGFDVAERSVVIIVVRQNNCIVRVRLPHHL